MNEMIQTESFLIGSGSAVEKLDGAERTRILALSDTHGDLDAASAIVESFGAFCDALVFCGDGAADIASLFFAQRGISDVIPPVVALARGNNDGTVYSRAIPADTAGKIPRLFRITIPRRIVFRAAGHTILAVHGNLHGVDYGIQILARTAASFNADIVFHGHTHKISSCAEGRLFIINPGSCSCPRGNSPAAFVIAELARDEDGARVQFYEILRSGTAIKFQRINHYNRIDEN
jgi:putative phosphoesterase